MLNSAKGKNLNERISAFTKGECFDVYKFLGCHKARNGFVFRTSSFTHRLHRGVVHEEAYSGLCFRIDPYPSDRLLGQQYSNRHGGKCTCRGSDLCGD